MSNGAVSPGTGTTFTTFRFSVRYTDNANCAPTQLSVTIAGVGLFPLAPSGSSWAAGVTFSVSRRLPAGTWAYQFTGQSGFAGGAQLVTLSKVSPARVVVTAAGAAPNATPKPPAKPTPKPSRKPGATASPGGSGPAASGPTNGEPGATPETSPTDDGSGAGSGNGEGDPGNPGRGPGSGGGYGLPPVFHTPASAGLATWLVTTAGGLLFFAFLMRRRRDDRAPVGADGRAVAAASLTDLDPAADESRIPRWRRPSVQAGRNTSRYGETISRPPLKFPGPPASGVERVAVGYRFVRVADSPDNIRSMELGRLDRGDEVDVVERRSGFAHVRAPDGLDGWVPRMTLSQIESPD